MNIGRRFKRLREGHGLTQKEAAKALGIKSYQLANYESNRSEPNITTLKKMSKLYHMSIDMMVGNSALFETESYKKIEAEEEEYEKMKKQIIKVLEDFSGKKI